MSKYAKSLLAWSLMMGVLALFAWTVIRYSQNRVGRIESSDQIVQAAIAEKENRIDEAIAHYESALRYQPDALAPRKGVIQLYMRAGEFEKALSHGRAMLQYAYEEERVDALLTLGAIHEQMAQWAEARRMYEEAVAFQPERAEIFAGLARATNALRDYPAMVQAIESISKSEEQDCSSAFVMRQSICRDIIARTQTQMLSGKGSGIGYFRLGAALLETGAWQDACQAFSKALEFPDGPGDAAFYLGVDAQVRGDDAAAAAYYEKAIERAPAHRGALQNLLQLRIESSRSPNGESAYRSPDTSTGLFSPPGASAR